MARNGADALCTECGGEFYWLTGTPRVCPKCLGKGKKTSNRKTTLSFGQLKAEVNNPTGAYPKCLIINEIGEIFAAGEKDSFEAEQILSNLLDRRGEEEQFVALCWLTSSPGNLTTSIMDKVTHFQVNPANRRVVEQARAAINNR